VTRGAWTFLIVAGLLGVLGGRAHGEHEIYYRYIVLGYVQDARGAPVSGAPVELIREKTGFSYLGETAPDGFFLIIARLGDESAGERFTLRVGRSTTSIVARFDPANHADHRGTRVDLRGATFQERVTAFAPTLARFLATEGR
jgi:hypothetical protein